MLNLVVDFSCFIFLLDKCIERLLVLFSLLSCLHLVLVSETFNVEGDMTQWGFFLLSGFESPSAAYFEICKFDASPINYFQLDFLSPYIFYNMVFCNIVNVISPSSSFSFWVSLAVALTLIILAKRPLFSTNSDF